MKSFYKFFFSILVFVLTLGLSLESVSADGAHGEGHSGPGQHRDMTVLFPGKAPNTSLTVRPAKPELVAPSFLAKVTKTPTLEWKPVEGADKYHVQVASDAAFKWFVAEDKNVMATTFAPTGLETGKRYYWRVFAYKTANESGYQKSLSNFSSFNVQ